MIKGVNRQMIEVTDTGNPYFERALLVVRAECMEQPEVRLHEEAHKILASSDAYSGLRLVQTDPGGSAGSSSAFAAAAPASLSVCSFRGSSSGHEHGISGSIQKRRGVIPAALGLSKK